jgi:CRISPR-associated protein Cas5d
LIFKGGIVLEKENSMEFKVYGRRALFSDPINRVGGEKFSYHAPVYEALKGVCESIYWKPTFIWVIDKVRVMKPIQTEPVGVRPIEYGGGNTLSYYTYLRDVEYHVKAHFEWNEGRPELVDDRNENKHFFIGKRMLERGGRRDIFLGTRECQAYVEPCSFGEGAGAYDEIEELSFGFMFHGFTYPDGATTEEEKDSLTARFWYPVMRKGVIEFIRPEECSIRRRIMDMEVKKFGEGNFTGLKEFSNLFKEEGVK